MKTASQNQLYMKMLNFFNAADTGRIHFNHAVGVTNHLGF